MLCEPFLIVPWTYLIKDPAVANRRLTTIKWAEANFLIGSTRANMLEHVSLRQTPICNWRTEILTRRLQTAA